MASLAPRMRSVAANLHAHPEPPFQEYRAVRVLTSWLDEGGFDDVDAAMMFHPADRTLTARAGLAAIHFRVRFHGVAAHAAKNPEAGRSALNGVRLFMDAVDMLRQFMPPTARVHATIGD